MAGLRRMNLDNSPAPSQAGSDATRRQGSELFRVSKRTDYQVVAVVLQDIPEGTTIYNILEDVTYTMTSAKPVVMIGTASEMWPVSLDKFQKTYTVIGTAKDSSLPASLRGLAHTAYTVTPRADGTIIWAQHIPLREQRKVITSWGETLTANRPGVPHGSGDYQVFASKADGSVNMDDSWVVNGEIFLKTYKRV